MVRYYTYVTDKGVLLSPFDMDKEPEEFEMNSIELIDVRHPKPESARFTRTILGNILRCQGVQVIER